MLLFVFLIVGWLTDRYSDVNLSFSSSAVFTTVPKVLSSIIHSPLILSIVLGASLLKTYLVVGMGKDMMNIFIRGRKGLWQSLREITWGNFLWYLKVELLIYLIFNAIAVTFYTLCYALWLQTGFELLPVLILFGFFAFFYPLFYFSFSFTSMVCVFPISGKERWNKLYAFMPWKTLRTMYLFYAIRLSVEYFFILVLPFIAVSVFHNPLVAKWCVLVGLLVPLLLLRGSAYTFKLRVLKDDPDVKRLFAKHFEENA